MKNAIVTRVKRIPNDGFTTSRIELTRRNTEPLAPPDETLQQDVSQTSAPQVNTVLSIIPRQNFLLSHEKLYPTDDFHLRS